MNKIFVYTSMFILIIFIFLEKSYAANYDDETKSVIEKISTVLPGQWRCVVVDTPEKPWWMNGETKFVEIRLIGPERIGWRYKFNSGETKNVLYGNETIILWITPSDYDDGWTMWRRFREHFKKAYSAPPDVFIKTSSLKLYSRFTYLMVDGNFREEPDGAIDSQMFFKNGTDGLSWLSWKKDLSKAMTNNAF